jgi:outer membrane biosynthesis protein TonB
MSSLYRAVLLSLIVHGFFLISASYPRLSFFQMPHAALRGELIQKNDALIPTVPHLADPAKNRVKSFTPISLPTASANYPRPEPVSTVEQAQAIHDFRFTLARQAKRFRFYPVLARQQGWEGVVELEVRLIMGRPSVLLHQSSGFEMLDREAQMMLLNALNQMVLPAALQEMSVQFLLPIEFQLARD